MKLRNSLIASAALFTTLSLSLPLQAQSTPETVPFVDVEQYLGTWYEIASIPKIFQLGCTATTAEYSLKDNGKIEVVNSCRLFTPRGFPITLKGEARVVDEETNSKLAVKFFGSNEGDYWIFDLAEDYSYVMVGAPDFDSLWILSRERTLDSQIVEELKAKAEGLGFDTSRLKSTRQPAE